MKLIASNQMTLTNLLEKAETRRETFYKLTNEGALGNLVVESKLSKGWLNGNGNGQILGPDAKGERTTDFIQVVAGKTYTFQWWATVADGQKCWEAWQFYDSNQKPFGSRGGYGEYGSDGEQHGKRTITAPANARYIRLSYRSFGNGHMMFEAGAGSASFEPSFDDSLKKGSRNLAQSSTLDWSNPYTSFHGGINHIFELGKVLTQGLKVGDTIKGRVMLKYDNIVPAEGKTAQIWLQGAGDVTEWNTGAMPNDPNGGKRTISGSGETVFETSSLITADHLKNNFWKWAFRIDNVASGSLRQKESKIEIGTQTPYTPAPEQLGWSSTPLVPTQEQRYLWKFEYIYYSDGSVEVTAPVNISIAGADGTNGQTSHVHFAFADNATGGGFSLTTPKAYMGWYADFNETASNDPTKYKWGKWKGDQGAPGGKGDDGKTSYLHLAFASSADGKTGFSFTESGQQYQGYYTDFTQTSSTDPTKYTWMDRRAGVEVGMVNLLRNSKSFTGSNITGSGKLLTETYNGCAVRYFKNTNENSRYQDVIQFNNIVNPKVNSEYVVSFWAKGSGTISTFFHGPANYLLVASGHTSQGKPAGSYDGNVKFDLSDDWQRYWVVYKLKNAYPTSDTTVTKHLLFRHDNNSTEEEVWLAGCKVEDGNIPTPYTRNPEDVQSDIDSKADQALTQQQLNALAEQNSIVKAEMEAKASIDTVNQWITAYQNYVNANDEAKAESERNLQEASARILQLKTDVGTLRQQWDFIDTYMTVQNEGLIIGKSDGSAYAKFANDRISLFSGSSEVMYISQGVLRIENGIFTKTIQIGRFRFETHPADQDMLVLRYLGG